MVDLQRRHHEDQALLLARPRAKNIYGFFVSTHYPSAVIGDGGAPVHYQRQVLATVPRSAFGSGF